MAEKASSGPVVVGIDGSGAGFEAMRHAALEARWRGVPLHVVHVLDVMPAVLHLQGDQALNTRELAESDRAEIWRLAGEVIDLDTPDVIRVGRDGNPGKTLIAYCDEVAASVLVVGPRGRGRVQRALLGSTAEVAVKSAACDVLVVKSR